MPELSELSAAAGKVNFTRAFVQEKERDDISYQHGAVALPEVVVGRLPHEINNLETGLRSRYPEQAFYRTLHARN
jgi:hypothetical protein